VNVLIVDDEEGMRMALGDFLEREGWSVLAAVSGEQAWDLHARGKTNLVLCDWDMPGVDGLELCRRVRAVPRAAYTYFVLMTGLRLTRDRVHEAMRAGIDDVLAKPLDLVQVSLRLRAAKRVLTFANRLRELESVIPICSYCRRLRDEKEGYRRMEDYFLRNAGVLFTHGACPDCAAKMLGGENHDSPA